MRLLILILLFLAGSGANCEEDIKDVAVVGALAADYEYHQICQACHHHMWQDHGFKVSERPQVEGISYETLDEKYICRQYWQCMYCQEEVIGPTMPCTQKIIDEYVRNRGK